MKDKTDFDKAIDFILEREEDDDYICERMNEHDIDWCEKNCIDTLKRKCVLKYLKEVYK